MAKNWVTQDVYNAMKGLASDKNEYEYLDSVGATPERDAYGKAAAAKYDVINAYSPELRQTLKYSNAQQTRDLLKDYGVARDAKTISADIIAKKFGYENTKAKNPNADLTEFDATDLYDELNAVDPSMATMLRNMNYQQAIDWQKTGAMPSVYQPETAASVAGSKKRTENEIVADIAKYKFAYEDAKAKGLDYKPFEQQVASLYDELGAVNPSTVALVKGMDYNQTNAWLSGEKPTVTQPPKQQSIWDVGNTILGFKLGYEGGMKNGVQGFDKNYYNAQPYYEQLRGMGPEGEALAATLEGMNAEEAKAYLSANKPKTPMTVNDMFGDTHNQISNSGNTILSNIDKMYFDGNFAKDVTDMFNMYGNTEGAKELAKGAAANGGNYDSFANYNRHNTNLAYMLAGQNAVQNMRRGYAEDATKFLDIWGNQLSNNAVNFGDYDYKTRALETEERMNADNNLTTRYGYDKGFEEAKYTADSALAGTKITSAADIDIAKIQADADKHGYDAQVVIKGIEKEIAEKGYVTDKEIADIQANATIVSSGHGGVTPNGTVTTPVVGATVSATGATGALSASGLNGRAGAVTGGGSESGSGSGKDDKDGGNIDLVSAYGDKDDDSEVKVEDLEQPTFDSVMKIYNVNRDDIKNDTAKKAYDYIVALVDSGQYADAINYATTFVISNLENPDVISIAKEIGMIS